MLAYVDQRGHTHATYACNIFHRSNLRSYPLSLLRLASSAYSTPSPCQEMHVTPQPWPKRWKKNKITEYIFTVIFSPPPLDAWVASPRIARPQGVYDRALSYFNATEMELLVNAMLWRKRKTSNIPRFHCDTVFGLNIQVLPFPSKRSRRCNPRAHTSTNDRILHCTRLLSGVKCRKKYAESTKIQERKYRDKLPRNIPIYILCRWI